MKTYAKSWLAVTALALAGLSAIVLISRPARAAGPWYVAPGGSDGNSCLNTGSPCATINGAIAKVSSGDTIKVATGTYTTVTGTEVVNITQTVTLSGGWDSTFTTHSDASIIDGGGARRGITVNSSSTVTVDGFVVQNGYSSYSGFGGSGIVTAHDFLESWVLYMTCCPNLVWTS